MFRPSCLLWLFYAQSTDKACPEVTLHLRLRCGIVANRLQHVVFAIGVTYPAPRWDTRVMHDETSLASACRLRKVGIGLYLFDDFHDLQRLFRFNGEGNSGGQGVVKKIPDVFSADT
jgi:hypothetical protein